MRKIIILFIILFSFSVSAQTPTPTTTPATGSCCDEAGHGPGCDNASCQNCICNCDVTCCVDFWDRQCALEAKGIAAFCPANSCNTECGCITPSPTRTNTPTKTPTPTITPTNTPTKTPTKTLTPTITPTVTKTPTRTRTPTRTKTSVIPKNSCCQRYLGFGTQKFCENNVQCNPPDTLYLNSYCSPLLVTCQPR